MAALDEEEGKLLAMSSSSWYRLINFIFFLFLLAISSPQILEIFGCKFNKRDLFLSFERLSETHSAFALPVLSVWPA